MDILSTSLLLPLILDFLKERRHRGESEDFDDFKTWLSANIDRLIAESANSFEAIRKSQELQEGRLDEILIKLDKLVIGIEGPSINQIWSALAPSERDLLEKMFSKVRKDSDADGHLDLGKYSPDAQRLEERGLARVRESTASYGVTLTDCGAVLSWAMLDRDSLDRFESALRNGLPDRSATMRLGNLTKELDIPDGLALRYVELLAQADLVDLQANTWPPGQSLIYNVSESFRQNPPQTIDLLKVGLPEFWR